jgi:REP element-mobilizing transposase RayT
MFTRHRLAAPNKLDCPHAMGTNAFSAQRAESFRHFLLLPSPSSVYHGSKPTNLRISFRASAAQFQASRLRLRNHAGACPPAARRTGKDARANALKSLKQGVSRRLLPQVRGPFKPGFGLGPSTCSGFRRAAQTPRDRLNLSGEQHFWQKRYYDFNIRNYPQFVEKLRYIHRNPVKAGLCERPEDWEWSSFRHYATGCAGRVEIESERTARKRERAAGRLCPTVELPHSSQNRA